ncbi:hypothetical protein U9M48_029587 [Paspalum notatum var. saurae]|uniref:Tf2-1-like SH3-like domain-containing protein n=1 Tax=Paspalum notatum var. saurae TaxID=547442 RepID=A0AAQ3U1V9_PASNO
MGKLKPPFFGPYHVTELINEVAVRLALPPRARIHDVFHVGLLKKFQGTPPVDPPPLPPLHHGAVAPEPERAVRFRLAGGVHQVLVQWKGESAASATWEDVEPFRAKYPGFQLEDELVLDGGRYVMGGILWFHNLTEFPHGTLGPIFPILVAGLHYLNVQISFQGSQIKHHPGIFGLLAKYYRIYLDVLTIPLFLIAYMVPQGSLVYWTTNGLFSVAQQLSLRNVAVRKLLGLPDTRAHVGFRAQKSPLEGAQRSLVEGAGLQTKLPSSDNGSAIESTTPNLILESIEGNLSESSTPEELLEQALQYLGTGCQDQAIPLIRQLMNNVTYRTAVERNPDLSTALIGMGQTLFSNRLFPEAAVCFEHAIPKIHEDDPLLVLAYFGAGLSNERQGNNDTAIKLLQRIAELKEPEKPINKTCYFQGMLILGSILSREGRNSEAAKYLRMAIAYDPSVERLLKECEEGMDDKPKSEEK